MLTLPDRSQAMLDKSRAYYHKLPEGVKVACMPEIALMTTDGCFMCAHMARLAVIGLTYCKGDVIKSTDLVIPDVDESDLDSHAKVYRSQHDIVCKQDNVNPDENVTVFEVVFWWVCVGQILVARHKVTATCN